MDIWFITTDIRMELCLLAQDFITRQQDSRLLQILRETFAIAWRAASKSDTLMTHHSAR